MIPAIRLRELVRTARERGTRALLVVETPRPAVERPERGVRAPSVADRADRLAARLGTEHRCLVHDARTDFDPALLAAEAGTVPAGGAFVLLVPPLTSWAAGPPRSRFVARFVRHLAHHLSTEPTTSARIALPRVDAGALEAFGTALPEPRPAATAEALNAQEATLERLLAHLRHEPHPLAVIEAPRGHGKSTLLGRLAAQLRRDRVEHAICAARRSAIEVLERHRRQALGIDGHGDPPPTFLAPDAALARTGDVLLVDEAASLPLPLLEHLLGRWRRIVLATTSAGYESAGRAFALRLPAVLDRERPGWLHLAPPLPLRWREGDRLDALLARTLMPAATDRSRPLRQVGGATGEPLAALEIERDALLADEPRLARVFALLAANHYQSTPLDLLHLLDAPALRLWSIEHGGCVLGAALVAVEPGVESTLHADVLARRRRLPHRLLPQLLAQCADRGQALGASYARVVRIIVDPECRRRGIGRRLVAAILRDTANEVEAVGASFGETAATTAFWSANGFTTFHRGFRRNPRSGHRSVAVLKASSGRTRDVLASAVAIHRDNACARNDPSLAEAIPSVPDAALFARDDAVLRRFARAERSLSDTAGALSRLIERERSASHPIPGEATNADTAAESFDGAAPCAPENEPERWLHALGVDLPPHRRRREARLRRWVDAQRRTSSSNPTSVLPKRNAASE